MSDTPKNQISSDEFSDDIFDPEIIYCVTKLTIEPFITCIFDIDKYEKGLDYTVAYLESIENKYLCISFGEDLTTRNFETSNNIIVKKGTHHLMGTILVVGHRGGTIMLNNPLTNISTMYYAYIDSLEEAPIFKKVTLIPEGERHLVSSQGDKIYISNVDQIVYKSIERIPSIEIERVPIGSWFPSGEIYPKRILIVGWKLKEPLSSVIQTLPQIKEGDPIEIPRDPYSTSEFMNSSLPSINEDVEIVEVVVHPCTKLEITKSIISHNRISDTVIDHEIERCCCVEYFLTHIYNWFVNGVGKIIKKGKNTITLSRREFIDEELP